MESLARLTALGALLLLTFGCSAGTVDTGAPPPDPDPDPDTEDVDDDGLVDFDPSYPNLVDQYVLARLDRLQIEPHWASEQELIRRMAMDLTGQLPSAADYTALAGADAAQMATYFMGQPGYTMVSQVIFSDLLKYSDSKDPAYSTVEQVRSLNDLVAAVHSITAPLPFDEFAKQVIMHPAYLSRFTSNADRATAAFTLFIGYEPVTQYDFRFANMFRGYELMDEDARIFEWTGQCDNLETPETETCVAEMWGMVGSDPFDAGNMLVSQPAFAEHTAEWIWQRYIGAAIDPTLPELTVALGDLFAESGYSMNSLTHEIVTSAAYTQSYEYRPDDLVLDD